MFRHLASESTIVLQGVVIFLTIMHDIPSRRCVNCHLVMSCHISDYPTQYPLQKVSQTCRCSAFSPCLTLFHHRQHSWPKLSPTSIPMLVYFFCHFYISWIKLSFHSPQPGQHLQVCDILHVGTFHFSWHWVQTLAILICLESSFWYSHQKIGFQPTFEQSWKIFAHSDAKKRVEQDISTLIPRAPAAINQKLTEQQKATLFDIILWNCLGRLYQ